MGSTILLSVGGVGMSREEMNLQGRPSDQDVADPLGFPFGNAFPPKMDETYYGAAM